ncbi:universal stress protein [Methylobacterium sp. JK268]
MTYASLMVSLDLGPDAPARVRLAADLAGRFDAGLIGVAARAVPDPLTATTIEEAEALYEGEKDRALAEIEEAQEIFRRGTVGHAETAWRSAIAHPEPYLALQCRAADLVVAGRDGAAAGPLGVAPGALLMEAGRPVLVVPPGRDRLDGTRVLVAWKDAPECRRAVAAALPLLQAAREVRVLGLAPETDGGALADVAAHLVRHGVAAAPKLGTAAERRPGDAIAAETAALGADLVVMGAYGHSRLREWLFGGATRAMLHAATVCCLMSH